jgi:hypothetical protein
LDVCLLSSSLPKKEAKSMKLNSEERAFKMRMLEKEIPRLTSERREKAMKVYRDLLSSSSADIVYFMRA